MLEVSRNLGEMPELGKMLIVGGLAMAALGLLLTYGVRLPGDIVWRGRNTTVYFPLATCLLLSLVMSLIFWLRSR
jgi:hypothetical protein